MNLKNLCTEEVADRGIDIELFHPGTGMSLGIVITMLGSDSLAYIEADRKIRGRQLEQSKRKRDFTVGMEPEQIEAGLVERMTACFVSWKQRQDDGRFKDTLSFDEGVELASTKEEFKKIISRRGFFWLRQQVQDGMDKVSNFLPSSATPSAPQPGTSSATAPQAKTE
ncbi:hypothetical protein KI809_15760 [Geobacter pelophilus]|uniref:Uncharacterized protein n=1 Tax=Geoanaerobacter pelophilus TaxID=60036 RepID=A0AAW4LBJ1_9BACT|nr:hypothetical protein [Geoanaerobacter pelophilus]MBT0665766.1 hypothetical protein [Geoanaerobacter pelophilus]